MDLRDRLQATLTGAYTLERELGGGGMSRVFLATEAALGRRVVIKVLPQDLAPAVSGERFRREIQLAAQLQHPHIVPLLTAGELPGSGGEPALPYFTMPFVDGESLRVRLARGGELPISEVVHVLREVALALAYAHEHGVVHRDIKPDNVLMSGGAAMVTDFGVAKALSASTTSGASALTSLGLAIGTPAYMAPEQAAGDRNTDHRADIYAFGVLAYELVTGQPPFAGRPAAAVLAAHATETAEQVSVRRPACPPTLAAVIMRCLEKRPADRPQSARDIVHQLDALSTPAGMTPPATTPFPSPASPRVRTSAYVTGALVVGAILLGLYWRGRSTLAPPGPTAADRATNAPAGVSVPAEKSVAVLPLVNVGGDPKEEYFSDGMTDELIGELGKIPGLRVAARSSSFAFKGKEADLHEVGSKLHVNSVLEGTVRRAGPKLRVTVQLVNVGDGLTLWSDTYARELKDVFQVQEEIARATASALRVTLGTPAVAAPSVGTATLAAHDLYLKGRYAWSARTRSSLHEAILFFEQAIAADSQFAPAYEGLAETYIILPFYSGGDQPSALWAKAKRAALRTIELDSSLVEVRAALAYGTMLFEWDWPRAESLFKQVIAARPNYATASHWYADFLIGRGRLDEAITQIRQAQRLDPLSRIIGKVSGDVLLYARRFDEADSVFREVLRLDPNFGPAHGALGSLYNARGRYKEAIPELQLSVASSDQYAGDLIYALAKAGLPDSAHKLLGQLEARSTREYLSPGWIATGYTGLGEIDQAFAWLDRAVRDHDPTIVEDSQVLTYDALRADPRWAKFKAALGQK
jgi:serine/threonine-protein kinase